MLIQEHKNIQKENKIKTRIKENIEIKNKKVVDYKINYMGYLDHKNIIEQDANKMPHTKPKLINNFVNDK